jgi:hypothetical protein
MPFESEDFVINRAEWNQIHSQERNPSGVRPMPRRGNVRSASITCKHCSHSWHASGGGRSLQQTIGGISITCPSCATQGFVTLEDLRGEI